MNEELQTTEEVTEPTEVVTPAISETTETETPEIPEVEEVEAEQPPQQPQVDYKQKFVDSQREAILLNERNKQKEAHLSKLTSKDTPTDDELRAAYPWWDNADDSTKEFYRDQYLTKKELKQTQSIALTLAEKLEFQEKLDEFTDSPPDQFKALAGRSTEFKRFAKKKENIGLSLDVLAKAFLFDATDDAPPAHKPIKTPGLENGTGGPRQAPKPKKMPIEEAAKLRETNYREYKRLLEAGQIETDEF